MSNVQQDQFVIEDRLLLAEGGWRATQRIDFTDRTRAVEFFSAMAGRLAGLHPHGDRRLVVLGPDRSRR